jgi:hypothetical protein
MGRLIIAHRRHPIEDTVRAWRNPVHFRIYTIRDKDGTWPVWIESDPFRVHTSEISRSK